MLAFFMFYMGALMLFVFSYQLIKLSLSRPVQMFQGHINVEKMYIRYIWMYKHYIIYKQAKQSIS